MMSIPERVSYYLLTRHLMVTAEVSASTPDRRAWIAILPPTELRQAFLVRYAEVERSIIDADYDIGDYEELNKQLFTAPTETDVVQSVAPFLDDLTKLVLPYFCDYPF